MEVKDTAWALIQRGRVMACMTDFVRVEEPAMFKREMRGWVKDVATGDGYEIKELPMDAIRAMPFGREKPAPAGA